MKRDVGGVGVSLIDLKAWIFMSPWEQKTVLDPGSRVLSFSQESGKQDFKMQEMDTQKLWELPLIDFHLKNYSTVYLKNIERVGGDQVAKLNDEQWTWKPCE